MIDGKKILITGGAGFIGSALVNRLCEKNEITIIDNLRRMPYDGQRALLGRLVADGKIQWYSCDISNAKEIDNILVWKSYDIIIHCAAIAGIDTTIKCPVDTMRINALGTFNMLDWVKWHNSDIELFINFSTSEVFGNCAFNSGETSAANIGAVGEARWTYATSKLIGEHLAKAYHTQYKLNTITLRPFNVYGEGQVGEGAIHAFVTRALKNEDIHIYGDGNQIRAWCHIDDMIDAVLMCMEQGKNIAGESFNIGNSRAVTTIYSLAKMVISALGSSSKIVFKDQLSADIELRFPNTVNAKERLGFEAKIDLDEGLRRTGKWYAANC